MKKTVLATYKRERTLPHYCRAALAYATHIVEIECSFCDYSEERKEHEDDQMTTYRYNPVTKEKKELTIEDMFGDRYSITTTDAAGVKKNRLFRTKEEANRAFLNIKSHFTGWRKM